MIISGPTHNFCRIYLIGLVIMAFLLWLGSIDRIYSETIKTYVGSDACKDCHEKEYENFTNYSKKSRSFKSISIRRKGLTEAEFQKCLECHTTGYGKPGGFQSETTTPHLKNAGCEVCHGPGNVHVKTGSRKDIKRQITTKDCESCHNEERVATFNYKPVMYGGAH
jgi:hypothetical protein